MSVVRPAVSRVQGITAACIVAATVSMALWHVRMETETFFPFGFVRLSVSLAAVAVVCLARRQTLLKRAMCVLAIETAGGIVAFVVIDVPFVRSHQAQIGHFAIAVHERLARRSY